MSVPAAAVGLTDDDGYHAVALDDGSQIRARTVLVATGAQYRKPCSPHLMHAARALPAH
jgi:thioredoxin reductase (NADPH)